jgi:serine/threonine-protein kinase
MNFDADTSPSQKMTYTCSGRSKFNAMSSRMVGRLFLGRYEALRLLGEGGMGRVYLARQVDLGRQVVVKVMHDHIASDPKFRERFQRETLLMARFQHPYVVTLYDASLNDPEGPCIVMEYIKGITLDTLLMRNTRLNPARAGRLLGQLCEALQAAHSQGIVHRDLKPTNLMVVDPDTPYEKIKVMDFGLAKLVEAGAMPMYNKVSDTGADFAVGTPGYISPEQVKGEDMDHRSDLYSVGIILFELLTGRLPFNREETMDVLLAHATEPAPSFSEVGAAGCVAPEIEAMVQSCLAKDPAERPASAMDLAERYDTALARANGELGPMADQPETTAAAPVRQPAATVVYDPQSVIHQMEAWMPDSIATYKLKGFVNDFRGEVVESVPGMIRVQLGGANSANGSGSPLSWLRVRKKTDFVDMELRLERNNPQQASLLHITVIMRALDSKTALSQAWREHCNYLFCELRGYLAGASV